MKITDKIESSSLHQLRFYPQHPYQADISTTAGRQRYESWLHDVTMELFGIPLVDFTPVQKTTIANRKVHDGYSYQDKILLILSHYQGNVRLSIELNGSAFDELNLEWDQLYSTVDAGYTVTDIHAKLDTTSIPFRKLWDCYKNDSVTADVRQHSEFKQKARSIYFGSGEKVYSIYEAGKFHGMDNPAVVRHELQLSRSFARQFWDAFYCDQENLGALIKSHIVGTFAVQFRKITNDSNVARRPVLTSWKKWLDDQAPSYLKHQIKPVMMEKDVKRTVAYLLKARRSLSEPVYLQVLQEVENIHLNPLSVPA